MTSLTSPQKSVSPKKLGARKFNKNARDDRSVSVNEQKNRVVDNNYLGKKIDKMTELAMKTDPLDKTSIYTQDYQAQKVAQSAHHGAFEGQTKNGATQNDNVSISASNNNINNGKVSSSVVVQPANVGIPLSSST